MWFTTLAKIVRYSSAEDGHHASQLKHSPSAFSDRVISSGSPRIKFLGSGAIRIESVKETDAANYTCHVTNSYGKDHVEYALTIASDPSTVCT